MLITDLFVMYNLHLASMTLGIHHNSRIELLLKLVIVYIVHASFPDKADDRKQDNRLKDGSKICYINSRDLDMMLEQIFLAFMVVHAKSVLLCHQCFSCCQKGCITVFAIHCASTCA